MNKVDLHTHSNQSDGTLSPRELIQKAFHMGLQAIALTDHDTADGLFEAQKTASSLCREHNFEFIPGIELSVSYKEKELHIVGLHLNIHSKNFINELKKLQENRNNRNLKMITIMQKAGIDITMEKLNEDQGTGVLTRANFSRYLLNHGYIKSIQEGFDKYLEAGKPFYVPREYMSPESAIKLIHNVHGLAVLAHPLLYHFSPQELDAAVASLKSLGIDAMEIYYSMNTVSDTVAMKKLAQKYDLIPSGGSDFHGSNKPHIGLGTGRGQLYIPEDIVALQKDYLRKKFKSIT